MNSYVFTAFMISIIAYQVFGQDQFYGNNEVACLRKGGLCIQSSECESLVKGDGLCAEQKSFGFDCCYGLPKSESRCQKRGGECFAKNHCAPALLYFEATDCGAEEECCILI